MTISKQFRVPTGLLDSLKKQAEISDTNTNRIACDALRRGLLTYNLVPYRPMKTSRDLRLLEKQLSALTNFLVQDLRALQSMTIDDSTEGERANGIDGDDPALWEMPQDFLNDDGFDDLDELLNSGPSWQEIMDELDEQIKIFGDDDLLQPLNG